MLDFFRCFGMNEEVNRGLFLVVIFRVVFSIYYVLNFCNALNIMLGIEGDIVREIDISALYLGR